MQFDNASTRIKIGLIIAVPCFTYCVSEALGILVILYT